MARVRFVVTNPADVALAAATPKTVVQVIAAANHRVALDGIAIFFDGTNGAATPVQVSLLRQTNAIGGSPTTLTPKRTDGYVPQTSSNLETLQTTAAQSAGGTEPTSGDELGTWKIHPQSGTKEILPMWTREYLVPGGARVGLVVTAPATVNCRVEVTGEE